MDMRSTWCGIHWLGWVSFATLVIGVACLMTAVAIPNFFSYSDTDGAGNSFTYYIGLWNICSPDLRILTPGGSTTPVTGFACLPIDNSCNTIDGSLNVATNCSQFHAMQAVLVIACAVGAIAIFANWSALAIMLAHGSLSAFVVKMGGFFLSCASGGLGLLMMILTVNEKSSILGKYKVQVDYHASFGVLIVGWILTIVSAVTFAISARRCGGGFNTEGRGDKGNFTDDV